MELNNLFSGKYLLISIRLPGNSEIITQNLRVSVSPSAVKNNSSFWDVNDPLGWKLKVVATSECEVVLINKWRNGSIYHSSQGSFWQMNVAFQNPRRKRFCINERAPLEPLEGVRQPGFMLQGWLGDNLSRRRLMPSRCLREEESFL